MWLIKKKQGSDDELSGSVFCVTSRSGNSLFFLQSEFFDVVVQVLAADGQMPGSKRDIPVGFLRRFADDHFLELTPFRLIEGRFFYFLCM